MEDREERIRMIAYFLWEEEGYPEGEAERHWRAAEALYDSEDAERKATEGEPPGEPLDGEEHSKAPPTWSSEDPSGDPSRSAFTGERRAADRAA